MSETIAIALSGGIDSLVAAALLKEQGHRVIGLHFFTGYEATAQKAHEDGPKSLDCAEMWARKQLQPLVDQLGIPLHIIDLSAAFRESVVGYFVATYQAGRTPNPCLVCNASIKFDHLLKKARALGAAKIATGHYARIEKGPADRLRLLCGIDTHKDQSYFLAMLNQAQLGAAVLPLGRLTKSQTRQLALQRSLSPVGEQESQDVCFIRQGTYAAFVAREAGISGQAGPVEDIHGNIIGRHHGLHLFTVGQRRGINCPAAEPYYVVRLEPERNCLVVGQKQDLFVRSCRVQQINWIAPAPDKSVKALVRIRYRHKAVPATIVPGSGRDAEVLFDTPEAAVTPGQGAVFYHDDEVLGGGWIR